MTVRLPGGRFVPIDAKVPMSAYLDSLDPALSDADRAARRTAHAQALRTHVRALASREYAKALGEGVEITVLFVPLESGLIAALEEDGTLYEEALDQRVIITTAVHSARAASHLRAAVAAGQAQRKRPPDRRQRPGAPRAHRASSPSTSKRSARGSRPPAKGYNSAVGSFNGRLLPGARETAELAGNLERLPGELEPASTVLREVNVRSLPSGN
jgi:DNA recombination protein RmuC